MFKKKGTNEGSNFWISYADLMAGLLFVFILLIGAIVSKSIILKSNLHEKEDRLESVNADLSKNKSLLSQREQQLNLNKEEIKKLNKMLLEANTQKDLLNNKIVVIQNLVTQKDTELGQQKKRIEDFEGKVLVLSNQLTDSRTKSEDQEKKMLALLNALDEKQTRYDELVAKLQEQKAKIKSFTGIRLKVIAALKDTLGNKVNIDKKSGSLKLSSNVLFDSGSDELKPGSEEELRKAFEEYIGTLVTDQRIRPNLERIIIEGHTDSDGGYLYNLELSQKRALAVMNYLLSLDFAKKYNIKPLMMAAGRAYLDPVMVNGVEDKEASRRIEIKFGLKNQDAMEEIEKVLDAK